MKRLIVLPFLVTVLFVGLVGQSHADHIVPSTTYPTIQSAIDAASDGDTVIVEDGIYTGEGNKNLDFKGNAITVKSRNGPDNCIIDCEGVGKGFSSQGTEIGISVIDGFKIQNCIEGIELEYISANIINNIISGSRDGGINIRCIDGGPISPCTINIDNCAIMDNQSNGIQVNIGDILTTITNCTIEKNQGDGILIWDVWATTISNCTIKENQNNGISFLEDQRVTNGRVTNCTITENLNGIELFVYHGLRLDNCIINRNNRHGIVADKADVWVTDSTINENQWRGIFLYEGSGHFANSVISGNSGGGITSLEGYYLDIANCIISGNTFGISFGHWEKTTITNSTISRNTEVGIYSHPSMSDAMITNTILWGNSTLSEPELSGLALLTNSNIDQDGFAGVNGNIRQNPLFVNAANDNYHLRASSPCIDAGDNDAPELPNTDIDGNPRIMNGIVDMGAYEYPGNQEPPVAYDMDVSTEEETPVDIILESYDKDLIYEFSMDKTGNQNNFTANGNGDNIPEPDSVHAEGDYSAYFESSYNEYLSLDDDSASTYMPWRNWTPNKTGTIWLKFKAPEINNHGVLFGKYSRGDDKRTLSIVLRSDTKDIKVNLGYNNGRSFKAHNHGSVLEPGVWYAVGVSFEQNGGNSADSEMIYIEVRTVSDGAIVGSNYSAVAFDNPDNHEINIEDAPYMIGAYLNSATSIYQPFEGYIDEVMIFNEKMNGSVFQRYAAGNYSGGSECLLDFEHTPLTYIIVSNPSDGRLSGTPPNVTYTPDTNFFGDDSFTFKVNDGYVDSNIATVNIDVDPVNDVPTITGQLPLETKSGVALKITLNDLTVTDVDNDFPDDFTLHVQAGDNYTLNKRTITPNAGFTGTLVVPVYVNDGTGNSNTYNLNVTVNEPSGDDSGGGGDDDGGGGSNDGNDDGGGGGSGGSLCFVDTLP